MSPEQAQGRPADARSDIFSFGCVLHEMITGRIAFRGDSPAATLSAILRDEPDLPSALAERCGPGTRQDRAALSSKGREPPVSTR